MDLQKKNLQKFITLKNFLEILQNLKEVYGYSKIRVYKRRRFYYVYDLDYVPYPLYRKIHLLRVKENVAIDDVLDVNKLINKLSKLENCLDDIAIDFKALRDKTSGTGFIAPSFAIFPVIHPFEITLTINFL